jgi:hypothetical protein
VESICPLFYPAFHPYVSLESKSRVRKVEKYFPRTKGGFSHIVLGNYFSYPDITFYANMGMKSRVEQWGKQSESGASKQVQMPRLLMHKNGSGAKTRNSSETSFKHKTLGIQLR